jgi:hypothetical protein
MQFIRSSRYAAFPRRSKALRRGITQEHLAELVSLNPRTIQKIEAGRLNVLLTTVWRLRTRCPSVEPHSRNCSAARRR